MLLLPSAAAVAGESYKTTYESLVDDTGNITLPVNFRSDWTFLGTWSIAAGSIRRSPDCSFWPCGLPVWDTKSPKFLVPSSWSGSPSCKADTGALGVLSFGVSDGLHPAPVFPRSHAPARTATATSAADCRSLRSMVTFLTAFGHGPEAEQGTLSPDSLHEEG